MAKDVNLTSEEWIDIVFEGKNKDYGAYTLRKNSPKRHNYAFIAVLVAVLLIVGGFVTYNKVKEVIEANQDKMTEVNQMTDIELDAPEEEIPEENEVKQFEVPPPVELKTTVQFTVPEIKKDEEVPEKQEMKTQDDLVESKDQISIADVKGTDDVNGVDIAELENNKKIVQEEKPKEDNQILDIVEVDPQFPGGTQKMYTHIRNTLVYPPIAEENGIEETIVCQFIVWQDGSIRDVKVVRGKDAGLKKEAIRVIKSMPRWIPGQQAGKKVNVRFTLPIKFQLQQ